ncbi:Prefoldin subunit-domain-containing protein, partial [Rhodotorula toruloides]
ASAIRNPAPPPTPLADAPPASSRADGASTGSDDALERGQPAWHPQSSLHRAPTCFSDLISFAVECSLPPSHDGRRTWTPSWPRPAVMGSSKYRFMESSSVQRRAGLEEKVPELERTIEMVELLIAKKEQGASFDTTFELADTLYAKGRVDEVDEVYIWLGASTMLSYPLDSAHTLLLGKLDAARGTLGTVKDDLLFLRDQITVTEVNVARVYNWDVARRRQDRMKTAV